MTLREIIYRLGFVAIAQNLVVPFRLEFPAFLEKPAGKGKKKSKPQGRSLPAGRREKSVYHRRLGREYENYKKD